MAGVAVRIEAGAEGALVRLPRPKIGELAHQAQGVRIFAEGEIPGAREEQAPPLPLTLRRFLCYNETNNTKGREEMKNWFEAYQNLDLLNGKIRFILEDDEDMIEILYKDGLLIDVGYIAKLSSYFITVVLNDDWTKPIEEIGVKNKAILFDEIQKTIYKYRSK